MKSRQRALTRAKSSARCWYPTEPTALVSVGRQLIARVSQIARCGSPWCCPLCAPVIREGRALEIDLGLNAWLAEGRGAVFVTLTTRHQRRHGLADRLDVVLSALRWCLKGRPWEKRAQALGYVGAIRAVEVTWGEENGWHPHCHAVLLFDRPLSADELADLDNWLYGRWSGVLEKRGLGSITREHGVDVRPVTQGGIGGYLTKVEGGWSAGRELARSDVKTRSAVELLRSFSETGESRWAALWQEFEEATRGKRAIVWSPGLRDRLLGEEEGPTDDELAAAEGSDVTTVLKAHVHRTRWMGELKSGGMGAFLSEIEAATEGVLAGVGPPDSYGVRWEVGPDV